MNDRDEHNHYASLDEVLNNILLDLEGDYLMHYGMPKRSGRYPYGSGEDPYQHSRDFLSRIDEKRKSGFTFTDEDGKTYKGDTAIAKSMNLTTTQLRTEIGLATNDIRTLNIARAKSLKEDGLGPTEIGRIMGVRESTVRGWFDEKANANIKQAKNTADFLEKRLLEFKDEGGMLDVGSPVDRELNISRERMNQALYILEKKGYKILKSGLPQNIKGQQTNQKLLALPDAEKKDAYDFDKIHTVKEFISRDDGKTFEKKFNYPASLDSKRLQIMYKEDGGIEKDGTIELRRNVPDLSLGESSYSQVRILVDGTHYLKGMAVYSDDLPDGVDVRFNTNKSRGTPMTKVLKEIKKEDPDNPFGSLIKDADKGGQYWYDDKTGQKWDPEHPVGKKKLGLINKRADEGDWSEWRDALPAQFLSKQSDQLAQKQLNLAKASKYDEFEDIMSCTNPTIKKHLLKKFSDSCDAAATDLKAAALPGQKYHVIIPIPSIKDTEIYAPKYENGTKLALVRYPHGGTFEIPVLTVNNRQQTARKLYGPNLTDAVCINSKVAEQLSGADFDGDTVMCIPTHDPKGKVRISHRPPLAGLKDFDPKMEYGPETYAGRKVKIMTKTAKGKEMGTISNLITDMTLKGATDAELEQAVRHSMVVIDAEKHKLDYKKSEIDNNIAALHKKYQGKGGGGASTIISKSSGQFTVDKRQGNPIINIPGKKGYDPSRPEGSYIYKQADDLYYPSRRYNKETNLTEISVKGGKKISYDSKNPEEYKKYNPTKFVDEATGEVKYKNPDGTIEYVTKRRHQQSTKMAETDDARTLMSKNPSKMERIYADYANSMKALANRARIEMVRTNKKVYNKEARDIYREEYNSLNAKLSNALLNATKEREALRRTKVAVDKQQQIAKENGNEMSNDDIAKARQRVLARSREEVGSVSRRDRNIPITDREWEAIQAGAISENQLVKILNNTDIDALRARAIPKTTSTLSPVKINRIKLMQESNHTVGEIAKALGVSSATVSKYLKGA